MVSTGPGSRGRCRWPPCPPADPPAPPGAAAGEQWVDVVGRSALRQFVAGRRPGAGRLDVVGDRARGQFLPGHRPGGRRLRRAAPSAVETIPARSAALVASLAVPPAASVVPPATTAPPVCDSAAPSSGRPRAASPCPAGPRGELQHRPGHAHPGPLQPGDDVLLGRLLRASSPPAPRPARCRSPSPRPRSRPPARRAPPHSGPASRPRRGRAWPDRRPGRDPVLRRRSSPVATSARTGASPPSSPPS